MVGFDEEERYVVPSIVDEQNAVYEVIEGEVDDLGHLFCFQSLHMWCSVHW